MKRISNIAFFDDDWYYFFLDGMQRLGRNITSSINENNVVVLKI